MNGEPTDLNGVAEYIENAPEAYTLEAVLDPDTLVQYAKTVGCSLHKDEHGNRLDDDKKLKAAQLRRFYDAVRGIEVALQSVPGGTQRQVYFSETLRSQFVLQRPMLAYAAGRKEEVKRLFQVLDPCFKRVQNYKDFMTFVRFFEAILAYFTFYR